MMDVISIASHTVSAVIGAFAGYGLGRSTVWKRWQEDRTRLIERRDNLIDEADDKARRLNNLRYNCHLTNAKGNRVRYWNATPEQRAKAEGMGE